MRGRVTAQTATAWNRAGFAAQEHADDLARINTFLPHLDPHASEKLRKLAWREWLAIHLNKPAHIHLQRTKQPPESGRLADGYL